MATDTPIPPRTRLHDKIKHLPMESQKRVLSIMNQMTLKHNMEVLRDRTVKSLAKRKA